MKTDGKTTALIMLGCPQVPVQTSLALYLSNRLGRGGLKVEIAGTPSARKLIEVADPERHYIQEMIDLDRCIADLAENRKDYDLCFVLIHNDAGVSYATTVREISGGMVVPVIFGEHADGISGEFPDGTTMVAAPATHNPMPVVKQLKEVMGWDA